MYLFLILALLSIAGGNQLDDYVSREDPNYKWHVVPHLQFKSFFGGTGYVLNVTSQKWEDESKVTGPTGALWTHQVIVIVPKTLKFTNISHAYLTGSCVNSPDPPIKPNSDTDVLVVDEIAHNSYTVTIAVKQVPNCPLIFASDPEKRYRSEDSLLAWGWKEYLDNTTIEPIWLPMAKSAFQSMKATQEFLKQQNIAQVEGWIVSGASKRGWTAWLTGAAKCESCPAKVVGIVPLVPIVPDLNLEIHRQWQAYNGFTFAFKDYTDVNITQLIDSPQMKKLMEIVDPLNYLQRLDHLPKIVVLSSDDEFMMMDWSNIYWNKLGGEKHLLIAPNAEHTLTTGLKTVLQTMAAFVRSIGSNHTLEDRPQFEHQFVQESGEIVVKIPSQSAKLKRVAISYAETLQSVRRDFRWVIKSPNDTCKWPYIPVPKNIAEHQRQKYSLEDDTKLCIQPIIWKSQELKETESGSGVYVAKAPVPKHEGRWVGYFVDVYFHGDTDKEPLSLFKNEYHFTTPGWTNPNTLPFEDCHGEQCIGRLV